MTDDQPTLTVDPAGPWKRYTQTLPAGSEPIGTVTREDGSTGALVRINRTGAYVQVNNGVIRTLDGRKVAALLGLTGRPAEMDGGRRVNVYLDVASLDAAAALGDGNISEGIRRALRPRP